MKKLNRKGFTFIELLAVIVILAIIVVVTVPTIISTIADARVSSIWNLAASTANSFDTAVSQDLLSPGKTLGGINNNMTTGTWYCIASLSGKVNGATTATTLDVMLDLSSTDVNLATTGEPSDDANGALDDTKVTKDTCSAIRIKANGAAEVLLVAKDGGKFAVSGQLVYALSSDDNGISTTATTTTG